MFGALWFYIVVLQVERFQVGPFGFHEVHDALRTDAVVGQLQLCYFMREFDETADKDLHLLLADVSVANIKYSLHLFDPSIDYLSCLWGDQNSAVLLVATESVNAYHEKLLIFCFVEDGSTALAGTCEDVVIEV